MIRLTENIKSTALQLGFSHVGIAKAAQLENEGNKLLQWLAKGYHAGMHWMERSKDKRPDPFSILPDVKSIVCLGINYYSSQHHSNDPSVGKISRYAWGEDYHLVMNKKLEELLKYIEAQDPKIKGKIYADTGPIMEKAWAVRAGIGWMGKHTNIITRDFGSWIFLGEILLNVELEYDEQITDFCGTCTACIDACPTQAIVQPYLLDSNKCISYLTIESRDPLPGDMIAKFQNWIYGCDICQDVCPWNRFEKETGEPSFRPKEENIAPSLIEMAEMTEENFKLRFKKSAVKRTKHSGLTRNARAVLESGNS